MGYSEHDGSLDSKIRGSMHESQESEKQIQSIKSSGAGCLSKDVAYTSSERLERPAGKIVCGTFDRPSLCGKDVANTVSNPKRGAQKQGEDRDEYGIKHNRNEMGNDFGDSCGFWSVEPNVGRVAHGTPNRVDRLKLLGNGQVVQVVEWIGKQIMKFEKEKML